MDQDRPARALLVLTFATGVIDAASFLALGQVFAAMQTGNVIFLGLGIAGAEGAPILAPLIGLGAFLAGSVVAAAAIRGSGARQGSETVFLLRWLTVEALLLALVAALAAVLDVAPGEATAYSLIALLSLGMGLRNTAVRGNAGPNLATTVLNLTLTTVHAGAPPTPAGQSDLRERAYALLAILAGAVAGALLVKTSLALAIALAAATALAAAMTARGTPPPKPAGLASCGAAR